MTKSRPLGLDQNLDTMLSIASWALNRTLKALLRGEIICYNNVKEHTLGRLIAALCPTNLPMGWISKLLLMMPGHSYTNSLSMSDHAQILNLKEMMENLRRDEALLDFCYGSPTSEPCPSPRSQPCDIKTNRTSNPHSLPLHIRFLLLKADEI